MDLSRTLANISLRFIMASFKVALLLIATLFLNSVLAYNGTTCCALAKSEGAFISPVPAFGDQICGQTYSTSLNAAIPLYVNYTFCSSKCRGMGLSKLKEPSEWAAPLVQFILPSVIFSMAIPRRKKIEFDYVFDRRIEITKKKRWFWINDFIQLARSMVYFSIILFPVFIDTIVWISVIVVGAGNMLTGGLYEAFLDYRIVKYVEKMSPPGGDDLDEPKLERKRELLATIAAGNLKLDEDKGSPQAMILKSLTIPGVGEPSEGSEKSRSRLLNLLGAQSSFGSAVGSPVLFYLGSFVYTILDLQTNPSSQDAAISLEFGIEWMIIVHVAIVSGCLLASNNPSTSSGIVGSDHEALEESRKDQIRRAPSDRAILRPPQGPEQRSNRWSRKWMVHKILGWSDAYDTKFQPVSLWSRGSNKRLWIEKSRAWAIDAEFRKLMKITGWGWAFKVFFPALMLIAIPPATGGVVAYFTPPRGLGCRSLSFILYASCQLAVTIIATVRCAVDNGEKDDKKKSIAQKIFTGLGFKIISAPFWFGSFMSAIGGTTMQITGVFRNCICYSDARTWYNINNINPAVDLASDTLDARNSSHFWIKMGTTATVFMALNCYIGWWYQRLIRHRFTDAVKVMYVRPEVAPVPSVNGGPPPGDGNEGAALPDAESASEEDSQPPTLSDTESASEEDAQLPTLSDTESASEEDTQAPQQAGPANLAEQTKKAMVVAEHLHAGPSNQTSVSGSWNSSLQSTASKVRARSPASAVSDGSKGDEIELLPSPRTEGTIAGT
jgi:hypothetical protein